jgi:ABC-type multidrug transport system fused ATPase/permease subunit
MGYDAAMYKNTVNIYTKNNLKRSLMLLSKNDRRKIFIVIIIHTLLALLDLLGVIIIGVIGALSIAGVASVTPNSKIQNFLSYVELENNTFQNQIFFLAVFAAFILIGKTLTSIFFIRKVTFFLSRRSAFLSKELLSKILAQSLQGLNNKSMQENLHAVTAGVSLIMIGILSTFISIVADCILLGIILFGLFYVDIIIALATLLIFTSVGVALYLIMHRKSYKLGLEQTNLGIESNQRIYEILGTYREAVVRNRRQYYSQEIGDQRMKMANNSAEISLLPIISKYSIEMALVMGFLVISALQFQINNSLEAAAALSVFLAASFRIAPAILRLQQGMVALKTNMGGATKTLDLIESLSDMSLPVSTYDSVETQHIGFKSNVIVENINLTYKYPSNFSLKDISFKISEGESIAIVGLSGAGKSTLVDLILGIISPDFGTVKISELTPIECVTKWPGAISYVPQDIVIIKGSIRENVALGFPKNSFSDEIVWNALETAQLLDFVHELPNGLDTYVGDRGVKISGGQRQRLGLARAMFTKPKLLVLDEATSSLDSKTEIDVSNALRLLKGSVTILTIAHRLSTIKHSDRIIYLENGEIKAIGSFSQIKDIIPDFKLQANTYGI